MEQYYPLTGSEKFIGYKILLGKRKGNTPLCKNIHKCQDNIKMSDSVCVDKN
jgi:hypothetical protein